MYSFFINDMLLPVTPGKISVKIKNRNRTFNTIQTSTGSQISEVNALKSPGLTDITFDMLIPSQPYTFARYRNGFQNPQVYLDLLERLKTERMVFQFIINRGTLMPETNITVSLEDYELLEDANQGTDFIAKINLKQYVDHGLRAVTIVNNEITEPTAAEGDRPVPPRPTRYTVVAGDTLWSIARRYLNDGTRWPELQELNQLPDPNFLSIGQVIRIA